MLMKPGKSERQTIFFRKFYFGPIARLATSNHIMQQLPHHYCTSISFLLPYLEQRGKQQTLFSGSIYYYQSRNDINLKKIDLLLKLGFGALQTAVISYHDLII